MQDRDRRTVRVEGFAFLIGACLVASALVACGFQLVRAAIAWRLGTSASDEESSLALQGLTGGVTMVVCAFVFAMGSGPSLVEVVNQMGVRLWILLLVGGGLAALWLELIAWALQFASVSRKGMKREIHLGSLLVLGMLLPLIVCVWLYWPDFR